MMANDAGEVWKGECKFSDSEDDTVLCSCNGVEVTCGEHFPQYDMLVTTKLTREARAAIMDCLVNKKVLTILGPSGTGKTESCKDTLRMLGMDVTVFSCGEGNLPTKKCFQEMSKNSSVILDEFNVLEAPVQEEVMQACRDAGAFVMVTANPANSKRHEYTWTEKHAHIEMAFTVPDRVDIIKVMLSAEGIPSYNEVARQMVTLYKDLEISLSKQKHYDFGLRASYSACRGMGVWLGYSKNWDNSMNCASSYHTERLYESCVKEDRETAMKLVQQHLGPDKRNLVREPVDRCLGALFHARHTAGVLGNVDATTLQGMKDYTSEKWGWKPFEVEWATEGVTFGTSWGINGDGTFVKVLREAIKEERACIYFSGEGWANFKDWADRLNTVNDDNRVLILANGERISTKNVCLVFCLPECADLTPATMSRIGWICKD